MVSKRLIFIVATIVIIFENANADSGTYNLNALKIKRNISIIILKIIVLTRHVMIYVYTIR